MTEECKKEIEEYLKKENWFDGYFLFQYDDTIVRSSFVCSKKGYKKDLFNIYIKTNKYDEIDRLVFR